MHTRILIGTALVLALAGLFWLDLYCEGLLLSGLAMALTAAALYEFYAMAAHTGARPYRWLGIVAGAAAVGGCGWAERMHEARTLRGLVACIAIPVAAVMLAAVARAARGSDASEGHLRDAATTVFGLALVVVPMALLLRLRFMPLVGWELMLLVVASAKASDIGAYLTGTWMGRRKLVPAISPKKTVEGTAGGLIASAAVSAALTYGLGVGHVWRAGLLMAGVFGLVVGIGAQLGDLVESVIKRSCGVKDSGAALPAFGGVLDMIDSFIMAAPFGYLMVSLFARFSLCPPGAL